MEAGTTTTAATKLLNLEHQYEYLELYPEEYINLRDVHSVSTLTFYDGTPPVDYLQTRINDVVCLNPWLDARSVSRDKKIVIKYRNDSQNMDAFPLSKAFGGRKLSIIEVNDNPITEEDVKSNLFYPHLHQYLVKKGGECVDKDVPLFHVAVLKCSDTRFALLVSISHTIADGHTYYNIYGMLSNAVTPRALITYRDQSFRNDMLKIVKINNDFFTSGSLLCNILGHVFCHNKPSLQHRALNPDYIAKRKKLQKDVDGTFISTNDIVTSDLFVHSNCDVGFVAVNFRGRIPVATNNHAGNFEGTVSYLRSDFETPKLIRQSVGAPLQTTTAGDGGNANDFNIDTSFRRPVTGASPLLPGFFERKKARVGIITNWCSFFIPIVLENCTQTLHIPVLENIVATGLVIGILYMALPNKPAIAIFQPENNSMIQNMEAEGLLHPLLQL